MLSICPNNCILRRPLSLTAITDIRILKSNSWIISFSLQYYLV